MFRVLLPRHIRIQGSGELNNEELKKVLKKFKKDQLMQIIREFNKYILVKNYSQLKKDQLISKIRNLIEGTDYDENKNEMLIRLNREPLEIRGKPSKPSKKRKQSKKVKQVPKEFKQLQKMVDQGINYRDFKKAYNILLGETDDETIEELYIIMKTGELPKPYERTKSQLEKDYYASL